MQQPNTMVVYEESLVFLRARLVRTLGIRTARVLLARAIGQTAQRYPAIVLLQHDDGGDGAAALERLAILQPAMILLDIRMPTMDGWAFAQAYERLPDLHVPVIVMTAARDAAMRAAEVKAAAYLAKPFQLADLYACIAHWGKPGVTARRSVVARGRWPRDGPHAGRRRGAA